MGERPLPVESLLPFQQSRAPETVSALRAAFEDQHCEASESPVEDEASDPEKPTKRPKRSRACTACRGMKIRCLPVEGQEACLSCAKVNRECIMPGPARKRQKTVHKVAELEKKINALTDALIAKTQTDPSPPNDSPVNDRNTETQSDITRSDAPGSDYPKNQYETTLVDTAFSDLEKTDFNLSCLRFKKAEKRDDYVDVIDRGMVDMETASMMFDHWKYNMSPYFPVVAVPAHVTAANVREGRPILFLAIVAVGASAILPRAQPDLVVEINRQLADRILFAGEKSLELVQATLVYTTYYIRSKYAKDLAFNQYIHAAVVMCLDLGMGKRYKKVSIADVFEEAEVRRTWLSCYHIASNVATLLRHPSLVRWSPYLEECVQFFATNSASLPTDKWLCAIVNLQRIAEEVSLVFNLDDPSYNISFTETKTQYHLKAFERQLSMWRETVPPDVDKRLVEHLACSINLYIHEIAIHNDHNVDDFRPGCHSSAEAFKTSGSFVTTAHIDALTTCVDSCHRVLEAYLALNVELARSIPNLYLVWNTYAAAALIKLHGVLHATDSKFGSIFTPDLRVDYYLDAIAFKLAEVCRDGRWPPAEAFGIVSKKLKSWHTHKKAPYLDDAPTPADERREPGGDGASEALVLNAMKRFERSGLPENYSGSFNPNTQSDLNAAFNAANYNLNWDDLNFSVDELNTFDSYMNDSGWMGHLI